MKIKIYTDDGNREFDLDHVADDMDATELISILYEKKIITAEEVNSILPDGFTVVEEPELIDTRDLL